MATLGKRLLGDLILPESGEVGPTTGDTTKKLIHLQNKIQINLLKRACLIVEHVPLPGGKLRWNRGEYLKGAIVGFKEKGKSWTRDLFTI